ncbi:hypothetical protein MBLNU13_g00791t1 [Cladosporium sp. NU13]
MPVPGLGTDGSTVSERRDARKRKLYESLREREIYAYYESIRAYAHTEPKYCGLNSLGAVAEHDAVASADATLTALDASEYGPDDTLWLGFSEVPRGSSVWEGTTDLPLNEGSIAQDPHESSIAHIINDLSEKTRFRDSPNVTDDPKAQFYAGVPIMTSRGINIGVLCASDLTIKPYS